MSDHLSHSSALDSSATPETPDAAPQQTDTVNGSTPRGNSPQVPPLLPESPAQGIRVGTLVWSGIVAIVGILMLTIPLFGVVKLPMLFIALIAGLGVMMILAALVSAVRKR